MRRSVICAAIMAFFAGPAVADTVTFRIKSNHENKVKVKFYSQDRNHVWPSTTTSYNLDDYAFHNFRLTCQQGEKICYGAWVVGNNATYWGVGRGDKHSCSECCLTCNDGRIIAKTLTPASNQTARPRGQIIDHGSVLIPVDE
jgi:hypothetical protein